MAKKTASKKSAAKSMKPKAAHKTTAKTVFLKRQEAVEENLGESEPLRNFLTKAGWY